MMEIAAITVLYNPDTNFINNIFTYLEEIELLIIVDNSDQQSLLDFEPLKQSDKVKFITYKENKGIAKALNDGIALAEQAGFNWVLTMDQDSSFEKNMIKEYLSNFKTLNDKQNIALVGPVSESIKMNNIKEEIKSVTTLITSGCLLNVSNFNKTGKFNEELFIDQVDNEYCYRTQLKGFSIKQFQNIFMKHNLGIRKETSNVTMIGKRNVVLHSPVRLYYMVRNSLYVYSKFKTDFPKEMAVTRKDVLVRIKNNLLYGSNKLKVLKYVLAGYSDYKKNRFGKFGRSKNT